MTYNPEKIKDRAPMPDVDYYKQQILPPNHLNPVLHDIHRNIHFYQDMVVINSSIFLLRDNVVYIIDSMTLRLQ